MRRSVIAILGSVFVLAAPAAAEPWRTQTTHITYAVADLQSEAGVVALYERITSTAQTMCAQLNDDQDGEEWCLERAVDNAVERAEAPMLTHYHNAQRANENSSVMAAR